MTLKHPSFKVETGRKIVVCGRYYIAAEDTPQQIAELIDIINRRENRSECVKTGEIFPGDQALVVANNKKLMSSPFVMKWGFDTGKGGLLINCRSETAFEKPMFRELIAQRRLLVPASGYFEWQKMGKEKAKYALSPEEGCMYMSGIYRQGKYGMEFVILTRDAAPGIRFIHSRMPLILSESDAYEWLKPDGNPLDVMKRAVENVNYIRMN